MRRHRLLRAVTVALVLVAIAGCSDDGGDEPDETTSTTETVESDDSTTTSAHRFSDLAGSCTDDAGDVEGADDVDESLREGTDLLEASIEFEDETAAVSVERESGLEVADDDVAQISLVLTDGSDVSYSITLVHGTRSVIVYEVPGGDVVKEEELPEEVDLSDPEAALTIPLSAFSELDEVTEARVLVEFAETATGRFLADSCTLELEGG